MAQDLKASLAFINQIQLPTPRAGLLTAGESDAPDVHEGKKEVFVVGNDLSVFTESCTAQTRQDVLNTKALAVMSANHDFPDREKDMENWYKQYRKVLEYTGWVLDEFNFTEYDATGDTFTIDKVILDLIAAIATQNDAAIFKEAIAALKALSDDDNRLVIFDRQTHTQKNGSFSAGTVNESTSITMPIGGFYFNTSDEVTKVLWFAFHKARTHLYKSGQKMTFDQVSYGDTSQGESLRSVIDKKVNGRRKDFVDGLEI